MQDYRKLNALTKKNKYPLPLMSEVLDRLKGARYYTKMDIHWGYNNVRMRKGDEPLAAFKTYRGLYEPTVMFFGLCNSPATFQTMMNEIFRDQIGRNICVIYMDDILIIGETLEELRKNTEEIFNLLKKHNLSVKLEKCEFEKTSVEFLGLIITNGEIKMDHVKLAGIADWPTPQNKKHVQSFLGFCNFYRRFVEGYAKLDKPLTSLV